MINKKVLDKIKKPECLWYEDESGEKVDIDIYAPDFSPPPNGDGLIQVSRFLEINETYCNADHHEAKWPVRFLEWIISKMPNGWKRKSSVICSFSTTVSSYLDESAKYLLQDGWNLQDVMLFKNTICSHCSMSIGDAPVCVKGDVCEYCRQIDYKYYMQVRVKTAYKAFNVGENVPRAFERGDYLNYNKRNMVK